MVDINYTFNILMQMGFKINMKVFMQHNGINVAIGVIKVIDAHKSCRFSLLGVNKIGVHVVEVIDGGIPLVDDPLFQHLEEAINTTIVWPLEGIKIITEVKFKGIIS